MNFVKKSLSAPLILIIPTIMILGMGKREISVKWLPRLAGFCNIVIHLDLNLDDSNLPKKSCC